MQWLATLDTPLVGSDRLTLERIGPQTFSADQQQQLARMTAFLLARSPSIRHTIKLTTEHYRRGFNMLDPTPGKTLIAADQRGLYDAYRKCMEVRGRWAILFSDEAEFIAGDGFLHNFPASVDGLNTGRKLALPILPTAMIIYMLPTEHPTEPRLVTLRLSAAEVAIFNDITQVYSSGFLFYREEKLVLSDNFKIAEHRIFEFHGHSWLDPLLDNLSQYNRLGRDGAAGMSRGRPFTASLEGS